MNLKYYPYLLQLKEPFTIAAGTRTTTSLVIVELEHNGVIGYGQASLPPYLKETQESVCSFLEKIDLNSINYPIHIDSVLDYVNTIESQNQSAKAAFDMALFDLIGKLKKQSVHELLNISFNLEIHSSFTISMMTEEKMKKKIADAADYQLFKIKLGSDHDKQMIESFRKFSDKPFYVDVNQGWREKNYAFKMIEWLKDHGCNFIEQPMPKEMKDEQRWLKEHSPLPLIADESFQTLDDLSEVAESFHGINIKLMKCGGLRNAKRIVGEARKLNLKILLGCMTESALGVTAATHLAPLADWCDLDGHLLASNDLFAGMELIDGKVMMKNIPGIGIKLLTERQ